jgi:S-adenosylmethionine-diacylglycerol 3-amino-3-carboxypropyl transferase
VVLQAGLRVGHDDDVLSVCASGDNSFAMLIAGARTVTAIDLSGPQIALAKLKLAAAKNLDIDRFRSFLGLGSIGQRVFLYHELRSTLDDETRSYWDDHELQIREGLVGCGKFETYLGFFRQRALPLVHRRSTIDAFLNCKTVDEQQQLYDKHWNTRRWRMLFRAFFSRWVMERAGRSRAQFAQVNGSVSGALLARTEHVMSNIPVSSNPFLQWILAGEYGDLERSHPYLSEEGHQILASKADQIKFVHDDVLHHLKSCPPGTYSAFNLSDIPEYLNETETEELLGACIRSAQRGARIAYWNLFVPRWRPESLASGLARNIDLGHRLIARDRAFFYRAFQLETVV